MWLLLLQGVARRILKHLERLRSQGSTRLDTDIELELTALPQVERGNPHDGRRDLCNGVLDSVQQAPASYGTEMVAEKRRSLVVHLLDSEQVHLLYVVLPVGCC